WWNANAVPGRASAAARARAAARRFNVDLRSWMATPVTVATSSRDPAVFPPRSDRPGQFPGALRAVECEEPQPSGHRGRIGQATGLVSRQAGPWSTEAVQGKYDGGTGTDPDGRGHRLFPAPAVVDHEGRLLV